MVWGCFSGAGLGPLVPVKGCRTIPCSQLFGNGPFQFQHDCAPVHKARCGVDELDWPAQSPDLNPETQRDWGIDFISLYGSRVLWCLFFLNPLYVCNSAVCDMELQFSWGNLPKGWMKLSKSEVLKLLSLQRVDVILNPMDEEWDVTWDHMGVKAGEQILLAVKFIFNACHSKVLCWTGHCGFVTQMPVTILESCDVGGNADCIHSY